MSDLAPAAFRVQQALRAAGSTARVREMPASTRTAEEAALACGCPLGAIVKSLVFRGETSGQAVLVLTSGANRVHETRLGRQLGEHVSRADAGFVRDATGFAIGGVAPVGLARPVRVVIDRDLGQFAELWAAAGTPSAVFPTTLEELQRMTGGDVLPVT